mmetsp:Transcript_9789/g.10828  ORF Transcript_9789/g.10828 Transcript_9789/m.10828 type:complete len:389 (-) Transcript_9789:842-2008(-)
MESTLSKIIPSCFRKGCRNSHRYESFHDINSIDLNQFPECISPTTSNTCMMQVVSSNWMKQRTGKFQSQSSVKYTETEKLRRENEKLKQRLNSANNTIRDLEHVCKKIDNERDTSEFEESTKMFCSFIPRKHRINSGPKLLTDDLSLFSNTVLSQASTVKMGSSHSKKKSRSNSKYTRKNQTRSQDQHALLKHQEKRWKSSKSCPRSLIIYTKNRQQPKSSLGQIELDTAPCTPERSNKQDNYAKSSSVRFPPSSMIVHSPPTSYILDDIRSSESLDIDNIKENSLPIQERLEKLTLLTQVVKRASSLKFPHSSNHTKTQGKTSRPVEEDYTGGFPSPSEVQYKSSLHFPDYNEDTDDDDSTSPGNGLEIIYESSHGSSSTEGDRIEI